MEVSHWGNIAIEEIYELVHAGAKLIGGFSRYDYISRRNVQNPSFRSLKAVLPGQATNVYYRDQIGNISTSDMLINEKEIEVVVQTRFPMFGGWKTQFYLGYSIPTELALSIDSELDKYVLKFDFFSVFSDVWVEDMEIKVILPEGAEDIQTQLPYTAEQKRTIRYKIKNICSGWMREYFQ